MTKSQTTPWTPIPQPDAALPPGKKGSYAVLLGPPLIEGKPRFCHLSWQGDKWVLRDFIKGMMRKNGSDVSLLDLWRGAKQRVRLVGELRRPIEDVVFWTEQLSRLTEEAVTQNKS